MIVNIDRKARSIQLSIKARDNAETAKPSSACPRRALRRVRRTWARCSRPSWTNSATTVDVTKSELIAALAARYPQLTARDTDYAVKTMLDAMTQALASGQRIEIRGFGSFAVAALPRIGRNPKSGEQVLVPGKQVPHFRPARSCASGSIWLATIRATTRPTGRPTRCNRSWICMPCTDVFRAGRPAWLALYRQSPLLVQGFVFSGRRRGAVKDGPRVPAGRG